MTKSAIVLLSAALVSGFASYAAADIVRDSTTGLDMRYSYGPVEDGHRAFASATQRKAGLAGAIMQDHNSGTLRFRVLNSQDRILQDRHAGGLY